MKQKAKTITLRGIVAGIEGLARMTAKGFEHITANMATKADINRLEQGQEEIKLRLDNVAYRFELVELQKRVERLEHRVGVNRK